MIVVSFLLGKSPASVYYCMPTFRNSLSVPSSKAMVEPIESSETSAYNNTLTPGTYPKEKKLQKNEGFTKFVTVLGVRDYRHVVNKSVRFLENKMKHRILFDNIFLI